MNTWSNVVINFYFLLSNLSSLYFERTLRVVPFKNRIFWVFIWRWTKLAMKLRGPPALMRSRFRTNVQHSVWRSKKSLISHICILSFSWLNKHLFSTQSHWWYIFSCKQIIGEFQFEFPALFDLRGISIWISRTFFDIRRAFNSF